MTPVSKDYTIYQGSVFNTNGIRWKNSDGTTKDLTGYTARAFFKRKITDASAAFECTNGNGRLEITGLDGKVMFNLSSADTDTLSGTYFYDLELVPPGEPSQATQILRGKINVVSSVTK